MLNLNFQGNDWFVPRLRDFGESLKHIQSCSASAVRYRCHFHLQMEKHLSKYVEDKSTETSYATKIMDCYKKLKMYKYIFTSLFSTVDGKTTNWNSISDDFIPLCLHHALVSLVLKQKLQNRLNDPPVPPQVHYPSVELRCSAWVSTENTALPDSLALPSQARFNL